MTFLLPTPLPNGASALLRQACFAGGYDQTPVPTATELAADRLVVSRGPDESGYLLLPWAVGPAGALVTTTATLRERPEPYSLMVELARGKLNQVRSQTAEWQEIGLQTTPAFDREMEDAARLFGSAALSHPSPESDAAATRVLERSYRAADQLVRLYIEQMLATRHQDEGKLDTLVAARYAAPPAGALALEYRRAFNAARVGFRWRDVEPGESQYNWEKVDQAVAAATAAGLPVTFGPVVDLSPGMLPTWAAGWQGDLPTLAAFMCDYLETLVARYRGRVRRWVVCAGFNHSDGLGLTDDDRLRLAARLCEAALQLDPELDLVLSVAQPWGDYLVHDDQTISPLAFADDLIRTGLKLSAIELELRTGSAPRGSMPRDLLDASRVLDLFGLLGAPLEVVLAHPASGKPDPAASEHGEAVWAGAFRGGPTPEGQAEWGASFASLAICKPQVRAVTWDHWSDADPHLTPFGGLIDCTGRAKPLLGRFQAIRTAHLR
jgi:hypothetical protein